MVFEFEFTKGFVGLSARLTTADDSFSIRKFGRRVPGLSAKAALPRLKLGDSIPMKYSYINSF